MLKSPLEQLETWLFTSAAIVGSLTVGAGWGAQQLLSTTRLKLGQ
jgi:hypothetical protein